MHLSFKFQKKYTYMYIQNKINLLIIFQSRNHETNFYLRKY